MNPFELLLVELQGQAEKTTIFFYDNSAIILAVILLFIFFYYLSKSTHRFVKKVMRRSHFDDTLNTIVSAVSGIIIFIIGIIIIFNILGLNRAIFSVLAGAGIAGLALAFAFRDGAANFLAGITLAIQRPFKIGDLVTIYDHYGNIEDIGLRTTTIKTPDGKIIEIPNNLVIENPMTNFTKNHERRVEFELGVSYKEDLDHVAAVIKKSCQPFTKKPVEVFFHTFGDSSINCLIRAWIPFNNRNRVYHETQDYMVRAIKRAFDKESIQIPWPIRTLDFDIKGGKNLKEMLKK